MKFVGYGAGESGISELGKNMRIANNGADFTSFHLTLLFYFIDFILFYFILFYFISLLFS